MFRPQFAGQSTTTPKWYILTGLPPEFENATANPQLEVRRRTDEQSKEVPVDENVNRDPFHQTENIFETKNAEPLEIEHKNIASVEPSTEKPEESLENAAESVDVEIPEIMEEMQEKDNPNEDAFVLESTRVEKFESVQNSRIDEKITEEVKRMKLEEEGENTEEESKEEEHLVQLFDPRTGRLHTFNQS